MPRVLADGKRKVVFFDERPLDIKNISVAEFAAAKDGSCNILSTGFQFGPAASDTVEEKPLCVEGNVQALGNANAQVGMTLFRYFDTDGKPDATADWLFEMHRERGNTVWAASLLRGVPSGTAVTAEDSYHFIEYVTDTPLDQDDLTGYVKNPITGLPQAYAFHQKAAAGTGG